MQYQELIQLLAILRERRPVLLYLGSRIERALTAAARSMGAAVITRVPSATARPSFDVLVVAPAAVRGTRRRRMEQALALGRRWGVPTLIDAAGAGTNTSATLAVRQAIRLTAWPVISAGEREAMALASSRPSTRMRSRPDARRLATALARDGGVAVVGDTKVVIADRSRRIILHLAALDRASPPPALRVAMLGTYLAAADRADFITVAALALTHLSLAAQRTQGQAGTRRSGMAQTVRELAAINVRDLHTKMAQSLSFD